MSLDAFDHRRCMFHRRLRFHGYISSRVDSAADALRAVLSRRLRRRLVPTNSRCPKSIRPDQNRQQHFLAPFPGPRVGEIFFQWIEVNKIAGCQLFNDTILIP